MPQVALLVVPPCPLTPVARAVDLDREAESRAEEVEPVLPCWDSASQPGSRARSRPHKMRSDGVRPVTPAPDAAPRPDLSDAGPRRSPGGRLLLDVDGDARHFQISAVLLVLAAPDELRVQRGVAGVADRRDGLLVRYEAGKFPGRDVRPGVLVPQILDRRANARGGGSRVGSFAAVAACPGVRGSSAAAVTSPASASGSSMRRESETASGSVSIGCGSRSSRGTHAAIGIVPLA